jgi:HTH-type transcriptional regulator / antitoxin HipB
MTIRSIRDLAAAVRGRRKDLGMSQGELATRAGVSRKWVYEFEAGKPAAEFSLILRVLDALELALELETGPETRASRGDTVDLDVLLDEHGAP